jgi:hypothetical protein
VKRLETSLTSSTVLQLEHFELLFSEISKRVDIFGTALFDKRAMERQRGIGFGIDKELTRRAWLVE